VEIGNEDAFDNARGSYDSRFTQYFDAIKSAWLMLLDTSIACRLTKFSVH
jgi:hypothetical protein